MELLVKVGAALAWLLGWVREASLGLLRALFGGFSYEAPRWPGALQDLLIERPQQFAKFLVAFAVLGVAGHWWWNRPVPQEPERIELSVAAPALTDYQAAPPTFSPLTVSFSGSAAPLSLVGKAPLGVAMEPAHSGAWAWTSDSTLTFTPSADWPVAQHFVVSFDPETSFNANLLFDSYEVEFDTAPFTANISASEFYQDPTAAQIKQALYTLTFSHPVDAARLATHLKLAITNPAGSADPTLKTPTFDVSYDERKLNAYVRSAALTLPGEGARLTLEASPGIAAARGGPGSAEKREATVQLPALYSLSVSRVEPTLVDDARGDPEQVLIIELSGAVRDVDIARAVSVHLLPRDHPDSTPEQRVSPYAWSGSEISELLLKQAPLLPLVAIDGEREVIETHSFKFKSEQGRALYVRVAKGLAAHGGFLLGQDYKAGARVPDYPQTLRFAGDGAVLSLKGEQRISVVARNVGGLDLEVARVLPEQLQHWVRFNQGSYAKPQFYSALGPDSLTERFRTKLTFPVLEPGRAHYEGVNLSEFFDRQKHGVFLLTLYPPKQEGENQQLSDQRLVVLSDLGVIAKKSLDGSRDIFVQYLQSGLPASGVQVSIVALNGQSVLEAQTDAAGYAKLPTLDGFERELKPVMITAQQEGDLSFLPLDQANGNFQHALDFSRFDIGGISSPTGPGALTAHLFSDRGLYRPGDTFHIGMIVRAADWQSALAGLPLRVDVTDPRGAIVQSDKINLNTSGFLELAHTPRESSPTGDYAVDLYTINADGAASPIGSTSVQVKEFLPDRMKVRATLSAEAAEGWVSPENLSARVQVDTLFGTAAPQRRVAASLTLSPAYPHFSQFPDFQFYDPQRASEGYSEQLNDAETDANGLATFTLDLQKYERATFQVQVLAEAFEAGGRSVTAQVKTLVSSNAFLVGIKSADSLSFVAKNAKRALELLALGPNGKPVAVPGLRAVIREKRYVSVLTRQNSGVYKYQSQLRINLVSDSPLELAAQSNKLSLLTDKPGNYLLEVREAGDKLLNQIEFSVAGEGNVSRSLERNAELKLSLSKADYAPGESIEISVRAPYTGSGLITIEREKVYAHTWFKAETTSSVQRINVPADMEGNGYITVQFVRDPQSEEVFMSPLSSGAVPFAISRSARKQIIEVKTPAQVKPGEILNLDVRAPGGADVAVFAVDEGILQVAGYLLSDPLDRFLAKRRLEVTTAQILDLMLPEFSRLLSTAAPGGDAEGAIAANLNPFKRKRDVPAAYWSGIVRVEESKQLQYRVPDTFNGTLRVMAVAVAPSRIGTFTGSTRVRGDFVLLPNAPTTVAPGDQFEVNVAVAYPPPLNAGGALKARTIQVSVQAEGPLKLLDSKPQSLTLTPGQEGIARFQVTADAALGAASVRFVARSDALSATQLSGISVRPAVPYRNALQVGRMDGASQQFKHLRAMWDAYAQRQFSAAPVPLVLARGLGSYLADFPHACSEQITSQALSALVIAKHPELGNGELESQSYFAGALATLQSRQNDEGAIGLWQATPEIDPFISVYAGLLWVEARERGFVVPQALVDASNRYLQTLANDAADGGLSKLRQRALAAYLLTRQGVVTTNAIASIEQSLQQNYPQAWQEDVTAVALAASYQMLKQDRQADERVLRMFNLLSTASLAEDYNYVDYYDPGVRDALSVYLIEKHLPRTAAKLPPSVLARLARPIEQGLNNTLSSALTMLALEAYAASAPGTMAITLQQADRAGVRSAFGKTVGLFTRGEFAPSAQSLSLSRPGKAPVWYALSESGYDLRLPATALSKGVEIARAFLDDAGKALPERTGARATVATDSPHCLVTVGAELEVRVQLRSTDASSYANLAITDLLPGGFEVVEQERAESDEDSEDQPIYAGQGAAARISLAESTMQLEYADVREDRVVLYAQAGSEISEFRYRIKATTPGTFAIPPSFAASMYERQIYANSARGEVLEVRGK